MTNRVPAELPVISENVVILTKEELEEIKNEMFHKGVERGKLEANETALRYEWRQRELENLREQVRREWHQHKAVMDKMQGKERI